VPFELLSRSHHREAFDCGMEDMNRYLREEANKNAKDNLSRTYVLTDPQRPRTDPNKQPLDGFYTLVAHSIRFDVVPANLPAYPIPVIHLARLAVDVKRQRQGIGTKLLLDALRRSYAVAQEVGVYAVELRSYPNRPALQFWRAGVRRLALLLSPQNWGRGGLSDSLLG
jgi:GNAT superfamily N-acetyltransferase